MTRILGYETTKDMEALTAFIARAEAEYEALALAIEPVDEKIKDLNKDWELHPFSFWSSVLKTTLPVIRQATTTCLDLFSRKGSERARQFTWEACIRETCEVIDGLLIQ